MNKFHSIMKYSTVALFAAVVIITSMQVVARYVFNNSFVWAEELARYVFIWGTMIAVGLGFREGAHLALNILSDKLKPAVGFVMFLVAQVMLYVFLGVVCVYGLRIVFMNFTITSSAMKIPLALPYLGIPVGSIIIIIFDTEIVVKKVQAFLLKRQQQGEV